MTPEDEKALDGYEVNYEKEIAEIKVVRGDESKKAVVAFVYIDEKRKTEGIIKEEYIIRMNYAIADALAEGISNEYIETYLRRFVPIGTATDLN
jgi:gamma-glutamylcyclotransferase